ncbi:MAG: ABC transporter ATP-binding protein [Pseudorhodoplanes sp.]|jgi:NitT/TauT family transport system ATP-binding protein|nr:ABC transporter ATP-binding protein [Pseudorhodoplanes sp.]
MPGTAIALQDVSMRYKTRDSDTLALSNVNLEIKEGEFVAVVGPSGCGKSTLLKLVAGLISPTAGKVIVDGNIVTKPLLNVGIVFQSPVLMKWRTVYENVSLPLEVLGIDVKSQHDHILGLLELAGIGDFAKNYPKELSGGMQQRVSICRALVHNPGILLLDEPFGALDAMTRNRMNLDLADIWAKSRKTTILITHSVAEAVFLADRVVVMSFRPGRVQAVLDVPVARPRTVETRSSPEVGQLIQKVGSYIGFEYS